MNNQRQSGLSLVEMLVVMTIFCILGALAMPPVSSMIARNQATAEVNRLVGAVNLTRQTAVQYGQMATLCGVKSSGKCGAPWQSQLTVFLDPNQNARFDNGETLIAHVQSLGSNVSVKWRAFQNRQYLQMTPLGYTNYQNGNFVVCPDDSNADIAKQVIINIQGRVRHNHATNQEGYPVDRKGKRLRC